MSVILLVRHGRLGGISNGTMGHIPSRVTCDWGNLSLSLENNNRATGKPTTKTDPARPRLLNGHRI